MVRPMDRTALLEAMMGTSATLAGLLLVFQGYLLAAVSQFRPSDPPSVRTRYRVGVWLVIGAAVYELMDALSSALAAAGMKPCGVDLTNTAIAMFMVGLIIIVVVTVAVTLLILP